MDSFTGRVTLRKFSGYPTQDPERFISDFGAYCVFHRLQDSDPRRVAAFQLHLDGPAQTWFSCLDDDVKTSWDSINEAFQLKYSSSDNKPVLLVETELFLNLRLLPGQQLDDYYSKIIDKGRKISKNPNEILLKFIEGLPPQLAFFVRAGNPADVQAALLSAKMGEAYGYRTTTGLGATPAPAAAPVAAVTTQSEELNRLQQQVQDLSKQLKDLAVNKNNNPRVPTSRRDRTCFSCAGVGHVKSRCNWNSDSGPSDPSMTCQICSQTGHGALCCVSYKGNSVQGNLTRPRDTARGPLGGK
ncbi:MAG: hypothetical protein ABW092_14180 [Candidatus Thiodiazotropha sp.]